MLERILGFLRLMLHRAMLPGPRGLRAQGGWVGAAAAIYGAYTASQSAGDAADAQKDATQASIAEQRRQFDQIREDTEPYRDVGQNALYEQSRMLGLGNRQYHERRNKLSSLRDKLGETDKHITTGGNNVTEYLVKANRRADPEWQDEPSSISKYNLGTRNRFVGEETKLNEEYTRLEDEIADLESQIEQTGGGPGEQQSFDPSQIPGYQFRMDEGMNALNSSLAASGNRFSGRAMKAAQRYGQGLASQEYGQHFNRLASLSGRGQTAVNQSGQAGMNMAGNVSNALMAGGQAQAQGIANKNRAIQGGIGNYLSYRQNQRFLDQMEG